jgi:hypothetical protein
MRGFTLGDEVVQRAAEPVQAPYDKRIAPAAAFPALARLRTARYRARDRIRVSVRLLVICRP